MDINLAIIGGRLVAPPEHQTFESGSRSSRFLITVKSDHPRRRIDVIPITFWDPPPDLCRVEVEIGAEVVAIGSIHRRFSDGPEGRRSTLQVQACAIGLRVGGDATSRTEG